MNEASETGNKVGPSVEGDGGAVVFYPISMSGLLEDEDDDNESRDSIEVENNAAAATKEKQHQFDKKEKPSRKRQNIKVPFLLQEDAIMNCFQLAVESHRVPSADPQGDTYRWQPPVAELTVEFSDKEGKSRGEVVDLEKEAEMLQNWVPKPLSLPPWAAAAWEQDSP